MSRIDELIAEHCAEDVEFRPLADITSRSTSIKWASVDGTTFRYIDLSSVDRVTRRIGDTVSVSAADAPSRARQIVRTGDVIFATTRPTQMRWAVIPEEYDGQIASTGYCVLRPVNDVILTNFLAHILGTGTFSRYVEANQIEGNYPSISDSRVRDFKVPVPPLEVQREIVRILDTFSKMEAELEAELEARKQQYEYYLKLSFDNASLRDEWIPMGSVGKFERGSSLQKKDLRDNGVPCFHYGQVYTHYGVKTAVTKSFVTEEFARGKRVLNAGDVFVATTSENEEDLGKSVAWLGDAVAVASSDAYIYRSDFDARYVSYFLSSSHFHDQKKRFITGTKVKRISGSAMEKVLIPNIPLYEQENIANMLDKFDALVNDLSVGLPAELAARRQQYEYYRDKLLTFKELEPSL